MKYKILMSSAILTLMLLLIPTGVVKASENTLKSPLEVNTFTIPNLDESGSMLQKTKEELGDVVKSSKITVTDLSYDNTNVTIKGSVAIGNTEKPFLINGTFKNSGESDKNRIILVGEDAYNNFDLLDSSFYYTTEWLTPFNRDILNSNNKSITTFYLLDKENRNLTLCEVATSGKLLEKQIDLVNNQDKLETADISNINWIGRVLKVSKTTFIEPDTQVSTRAQAVVPYTFRKDFTYFGDPYRDTLNFEMLVTFSDKLPSGGVTSGESRIQCLGGLFQNLRTGAKKNSQSVLGRSGDIVMDVSIEGINKHGFTSSNTMGFVATGSSYSTSISYGIGIPMTGLTASLEWKPGSSGTNLNQNASGYYNNASRNKFTRTIRNKFASGNRLHYSQHYVQSNFNIRDYGGSSSQSKVTAWYTLPFYCNFDGSTSSYKVGRTIWYK